MTSISNTGGIPVEVVVLVLLGAVVVLFVIAVATVVLPKEIL